MITTDSPKSHNPVKSVHFIQIVSIVLAIVAYYMQQFMQQFMLALCSMLLPSYYAQNYAGIIGSTLLLGKVINYQYIARYSSFHIYSYSEVITLIVIRPVCS